jgi:hypothetical protein
VAPRLGHSPLAIGAVRRYALDTGPRPACADPGRLRIRITAASESPQPGERLVERVQDSWGRTWASVFAASNPGRS